MIFTEDELDSIVEMLYSSDKEIQHLGAKYFYQWDGYHGGTIMMDYGRWEDSYNYVFIHVAKQIISIENYIKEYYDSISNK